MSVVTAFKTAAAALLTALVMVLAVAPQTGPSLDLADAATTINTIKESADAPVAGKHTTGWQ